MIAAAIPHRICKSVAENAVGFNNNSNEEQHCPIVGPQFFAVNGADSFKLQDLSIPGYRTWGKGEWDELEFLVPGNEFLRVFGTDSVGQIAAYTYISENYLVDMMELYEDEEPDVSKYAWAIGWWRYEAGKSYSKLIKNGQSDADVIRLRVTEDITFPNGTGFVGNFTKGHEVQIVTQGGVAIETFAFENDGAHCPIFVNQLPVDITLQDISIPGYRTWGKGEWDELEFLVPGNEFLREFGVESVGQIAAYTYISENYLVDMMELYEDEEPDVSKYAWAIGWWRYEAGKSYSKLIKNGQSDADVIRLHITEPITIKAGRGFVGNFTKGHDVKIYFPGATSVPSKQTK